MMKAFAVLIAGMLLLAQQPLTLAQEPGGQSVTQSTGQSEWGAIEAVPGGTDLIVETKARETFKGKFVSVSGLKLTLIRKNKSILIDLPQVQRVYRLVGRSRKKSTAIGAAAGGTAGVGVGLALYLPHRDDIVGAVVPVFAIIGAGVGAAIGAVTGRGRTKILIYEAN